FLDFFFSSRRRHTRFSRDWSSDVCSSDLRDFYWYSPTLKRQLENVTGDILVSPANEGEVLRVLAAAYELGIPVTPRGTGTGNYRSEERRVGKEGRTRWPAWH